VTRRASAGGSKHHWVYVHEHARDEGFHTHLLCVIPREKAKAFWTWSLATLARLTRQPRVHHDAVWFVPCTKQGFEPYRARSEADAVARCWDWFRYLSKTLAPNVGYKDNDGHLRAAREIFKLNYGYRATAPVHCAKLAGVSESIGWKAQVEAGFFSRLRTGEWDALYDGWELKAYRQRLQEEAQAKEMARVLGAIAR
jgi:hypothetical protein